jgi:glycogen debranching enzyme
MSGIRLRADFLSTYEEGIKREWIIGNGLGGYASSTVIEAGTRTYHSLSEQFGYITKYPEHFL